MGRPHSADLRRRAGGGLAAGRLRRPSARRRPRARARPRRGRCPRRGRRAARGSRRAREPAAAPCRAGTARSPRRWPPPPRGGGAAAHLDARARRMLPPVAAHGNQATRPPAARYGPAVAEPARVPLRRRPARGVARARRSSACAAASWSTRAASGRCRAKTYIQAPPGGDFRAMPAKGGGHRDPQVGHLVPGQPGGRPARGDGGHLRVLGSRTASCWRSWTSARSPPCAPARSRRWPPRSSPGRTRRRWASSAAASTAPGRRAASRTPSTGRASASTPTPTRRGGWPASSAGRSAASTTRSPATS